MRVGEVLHVPIWNRLAHWVMFYATVAAIAALLTVIAALMWTAYGWLVAV